MQSEKYTFDAALSMKDYWETKFPCELLETILTRNGDLLKHVEFAAEHKTESGTFMKRYLSFQDAAAIREYLKANSKTLDKLHIGAVWNTVPTKSVRTYSVAEHDLNRPRAVRAPLRIDIDLTDYTFFDIPKEDCKKNDDHTKLLKIARDITVDMLEKCFDLTDILCFYSGRRGVHLWVLDERAWQMTDEARASIINFLSCPLDKRGVADDSFLDRTPWYREHYDEKLIHSFTELCVDKNSPIDVFHSAGTISRFQDLVNITHKDVVAEFTRAKLHFATEGPGACFEQIVNMVNNMGRRYPEKCGWMPKRIEAAILTILWPRYDVGASAKLNHLIKSPFSVHSGTNRVALYVGCWQWPKEPSVLAFQLGKKDGWSDAAFEVNKKNVLGTLNHYGPPKPWKDPHEDWEPPADADEPLRRCIREWEEGEKRVKMRRLGIPDKEATADYEVETLSWATRVRREFQVSVSYYPTSSEEAFLHFHVNLEWVRGMSDRLKLVEPGTKFTHTSVSTDEVIKKVQEYIKTAPIQEEDHTVRQTVACDELLITLPFVGGGWQDVARSRQAAEAKLRKIVDATEHDYASDSHPKCPMIKSSYMMWLNIRSRVAQLWFTPGVVQM